MNYNKYNRITLILFVATFLSVVLLAISFWSTFVRSEVAVGPWPLIFLLLSCAGLIGIYFIYRKATDQASLDEEISRQVTRARSDLLKELSSEKEEVTEEETTIDISDKISQILPKGNFKTTESYARKLLSNLSVSVEMVQGIVYELDKSKKKFVFLAGFALTGDEKPAPFVLGENLNGQAAKTGELTVISDIPEDYFEVESGLGKSKPGNLTIWPIVNEKTTLAVIEIATFIEIGEQEKEIFAAAAKEIAQRFEQIKKS